MKRRIAYIGLSYPLFYDYENRARRCKNDHMSSPNPIIESPMGLLVLYDELVFLCRSMCPNNMRNLPYIKFVDEIFPSIYLEDIKNMSESMANKFIIQKNDKFLGYGKMRDLMGINWGGVDGHTHQLRIGGIITYASSSEYNFAFDLHIFEFLQQHYDADIEMVANSKFRGAAVNGGNIVELAEKIVIQDIPNYLSKKGPYHKCIEELREDKYIKDFRKWITGNHIHVQQTEIDDMAVSVQRTMKETQKRLFMKHLNENTGFACFKSIGKTILKAGWGQHQLIC